MRFPRCLATLLLAAAALAQPPPEPKQGRNTVRIGGRSQYVYFLKARNLPKIPDTMILFLPDSRGYRGFATDVATAMSSWGHDVFALDTRRYFAGLPAAQADPGPQVTADMNALGRWARHGLKRSVILVGWSNGAVLGALALGRPESREIYRGLAAIGLPLRGGFPGSRGALLRRSGPAPGAFAVGPLLPLISPAPLVMVQSTTDEASPPDVAQQLFADAREPKLLKMVNAVGRDFRGNHDGLLEALHEGIRFIAEKSPELGAVVWPSADADGGASASCRRP